MDNGMTTFKVNGRDKKVWELTDNELVSLLESNNIGITEDTRNVLLETLVTRYKNNMCLREGETHDGLFARQFSRYVNGMAESYKKAASVMARDHRYLQNEMFKLFVAYVRELAIAYKNKRYDPRNEYACETSARIAKALGDVWHDSELLD